MSHDDFITSCPPFTGVLGVKGKDHFYFLNLGVVVVTAFYKNINKTTFFRTSLTIFGLRNNTQICSKLSWTRQVSSNNVVSCLQLFTTLKQFVFTTQFAYLTVDKPSLNVYIFKSFI